MNKAAGSFLNQIRGIKEHEESSLYKACTVRLDLPLFCRLFALAEMANSSLNSAMVELLGVGANTVWNSLTDNEKQECDSIEKKKMLEIEETRKK